MKAVVTAEEMQGLDRQTIEEMGLPGVVLMESAGRAVARRAMAMLDGHGGGPSRGAARCLVLCAGGNNGGDGFVVARVLEERGYEVELFSLAAPVRFKGDARVHMEAFVKLGGTIHVLESEAQLPDLEQALGRSSLVVDALFGTGLDRPLEGRFRRVVELVNQSAVEVLAVDIPSGLRANDGAVLGTAVRADATVTMAFAKFALVSAPGFEHCGELHIAEIGIPEALAWDVARGGLLEAEELEPLWRPEAANGHKGSRGHLLVIAGSVGKLGAGRLCGLAALRGGAGLVTVAGESPDAGLPAPVMSAALAEASALPSLLQGKGAVVIGPGMASGEGGAAIVEALVAQAEVPVVMDADALNHLKGQPERLEGARAPMILTPHPGEAARLLGTSSAEVQADRVGAVRELARRSQSIVVLKGARTLICDGRSDDGFVAVNPTGGVELATAGSGDVLAGLIGALVAREELVLEAVHAAVYLHGCLGDEARSQVGGPGVVSSDLVAAIPAVRESFRQGE